MERTSLLADLRHREYYTRRGHHPDLTPEIIMKNQALTITLAILLAVSLSAIAALVVTSEVIGSTQTVTTEPAAVQVEVTTPAPAEPTAANPADAPADPAPAEPAPADAPADPAPSEPAPADPTPADPAPVDPADPADPLDPVDPVDPDDDDDGGGISILCAPGYKLVDQDCIFVACPFGTVLSDGICQELVFEAPCPAGQIRFPNGTCFDPLVVVVPELDPCLAGFTLVDGDCVPVCPEGHQWVGGFCLPDFDLDPPEFNPDFVLDLDLAAIGG